MNHVSLDTIGIAAFGHDFGALHGEHGIVEEGFDSLNTVPPRGISGALFFLGPFFPILLKVPTKRNITLRKLNQAMQKISEDLFRKTKRDAQAGTFSASSHSIIGTLGRFATLSQLYKALNPLVRAESSNEKSKLTEREVLAQVRTRHFSN